MQSNIPAFFSVFLLLFLALLLLIITVLETKRMASHILHWAVLSFGFIFMAVDEKGFYPYLVNEDAGRGELKIKESKGCK